MGILHSKRLLTAIVVSFLLATSISKASSLSTAQDERIGCLLGPVFEPQLLKEPFSEVPEALISATVLATGRHRADLAGIDLGVSELSNWYLLFDRLNRQYFLGELRGPVNAPTITAAHSCSLRRVNEAGVRAAIWHLATRHSKSSRVLNLLVKGANCGDDQGTPSVVSSASEREIRLTVYISPKLLLPNQAPPCLGFAPSRISYRLDRPLGNRILVEDSLFPGQRAEFRKQETRWSNL